MADGRILPHDDEGSGPQLVLLHSGVADRRMWADLRAALPGDRRVVAPDLRGFGASPMPTGRRATPTPGMSLR